MFHQKLVSDRMYFRWNASGYMTLRGNTKEQDQQRNLSPQNLISVRKTELAVNSSERVEDATHTDIKQKRQFVEQLQKPYAYKQRQYSRQYVQTLN